MYIFMRGGIPFGTIFFAAEYDTAGKEIRKPIRQFEQKLRFPVREGAKKKVWKYFTHLSDVMYQ